MSIEKLTVAEHQVPGTSNYIEVEKQYRLTDGREYDPVFNVWVHQKNGNVKKTVTASWIYSEEKEAREKANELWAEIKKFGYLPLWVR